MNKKTISNMLCALLVVHSVASTVHIYAGTTDNTQPTSFVGRVKKKIVDGYKRTKKFIYDNSRAILAAGAATAVLAASVISGLSAVRRNRQREYEEMLNPFPHGDPRRDAYRIGGENIHDAFRRRQEERRAEEERRRRMDDVPWYIPQPYPPAPNPAPQPAPRPNPAPRPAVVVPRLAPKPPIGTGYVAPRQPRPAVPFDGDECPLCVTTDRNEEAFITLTCGHQLCRGCAQNIINVGLEERNLENIRCYNPECRNTDATHGIFEAVDVQNSATPEQRARYDQLTTEIFLARHGHACPTPNCRYFFIDENLPGLRVVRCQECATHFCLNCGGQHSEAIACQEFAQNNAETNAERERAHQQWQQQNDARECPQCHVLIQRDGGCNHMTCNACHHQFCIVCGGLWNDPNIPFTQQCTAYNCRGQVQAR